MAKAADLVTATIATLQEFRSDSAWNHLLKYVEDVAVLPEICVTPQRLQRSRQLPRRLESGIVLESVGSREIQQVSSSGYLFIFLFLML